MSCDVPSVAGAEFGAELRRALQARNVTQAALAASVGVSARQANFWCRGISFPYVATGLRIAEALSWPTLGMMVRRHRTVSCHACKRTIVSEGTGSPRRYCNDSCRRIAQKKGIQVPATSAVARSLVIYRDAVEAMCVDCSPSGVCREADCRLRAVSPLPYAGLSKPLDPPRQGRNSRWDDLGQREALGAEMRARWADPVWAAQNVAKSVDGRRRAQGKVA